MAARTWVAVLAAALVGALLPAVAQAQVQLVPVGTFASPMYVTAPPGDTHRVFVVERGGTIRVVRDGVVLPTAFLDLGALPVDGERGLLSMAFPPDYATSGLFYVDFTAPTTGALTIEQRRVDPANPDRADPAFSRTLISIPHDRQSNHNGGQLQFGPDGMLYASTGDGGSGNDPAGNGQNLTSNAPLVVNGVNRDARLGKLLRLDPAGGPAAGNPFPAPAQDVWAYGLRNPWRFSFDRATGDLVIGDVGQNAFEEIDVARATAAAAGRGVNFGWSRFEGLHTFPGGAAVDPATQPTFAFPVIEETHTAGWCAITGGYVVRDPALPELAGQYVFGDFCRGEIDAAVLGASAPVSTGLTVPSLNSFGEDALGRVYVASLDGPVYRLASSAAAGAVAAGAVVPGPGAGAGAPAAGGAAAAAAPDTRAPRLTLRAATRQRVLRLGFVAVRVACDEACTLRARGTVLVTRRRASAAAVPTTRTVRRSLAAGRAATLRLPLSRTVRARLRRSLARPGRAATIRVAITATDAARNAATRSVHVRVTRPA